MNVGDLRKVQAYDMSNRACWVPRDNIEIVLHANYDPVYDDYRIRVVCADGHIQWRNSDYLAPLDSEFTW